MSTEDRAESIIPFEEGWKVVKREGIDRVLVELETSCRPTKGKPPLERSEISRLYTVVYQMCTQPTPNNWSGKLYYTVLDELQYICEEHVAKRLIKVRDSSLLTSFIEEWDKYTTLMKSFKAILGYLDRFYVQRLALADLNGVGIQAFCDFVFQQIKGRLTDQVLKLIERDRKHLAEEIDRETLRQVTQVYVILGQNSLEVYEKDLEVQLLNATENYMRNEAVKWLKDCSCSQYLQKVRTQLNAEELRVQQYLHKETREGLLKVCEKELISCHLETILNMPTSGCRWLLINEKVDSLNLMFLLLRRVPNGLSPMGIIFRKYLQEVGADLFAQPRYENQWNNRLNDTLIQSIIDMHKKYRALIKTCFSDHNTFHRALKEAFEFFVNLPLPQDESAALDVVAPASSVESTGPNKQKRKRGRRMEITMSELLSDFIDRKLRKAPNEMVPISPAPDEKVPGLAQQITPRRETVLELELVQAVEVFSYINEKDVFAQFYRKHLAKRLILGRSSSIDAEQVVIQQLQQVCGNPFVSKFSGMIKDLMLARTVQTDFVQFVNRERSQEDQQQGIDPFQPFGFDVHVKVLTSGFWPTYKEESIQTLPSALSNITAAFRRFYDTRTAHRTVTWVHTLSSMVVTAVFRESRKIDIHLNTYQGSLLLLFNQALSESSQDPSGNHDVKLTAQEMAFKLGISKTTLNKHLYSMVKGKYKILLEDKTASEEEPTYRVNWAFESKTRKVKIPMLAAEKSAQAAEERESNLLKISEERRYAVEAAIVRLMKTHKRLRYVELSQKVVELLGSIFQPQPKTIRKRVDDLVQRDYLELDPNDEAVLLYVA